MSRYPAAGFAALAALVISVGAATANEPAGACASWSIEGLRLGMSEGDVLRHASERGWNVREDGHRLAWHEPAPAGRHPGTSEMGGSVVLRDGAVRQLRLTYRGEGPGRANDELADLTERWGAPERDPGGALRWVDDRCNVAVEARHESSSLNHWNDLWILALRVHRFGVDCGPEPVAAADRRPILIPESRTEPMIPERARRDRSWSTAEVILEIVVEREGTVGPVRVVRAPEPDLGLVTAAIDNVRRWRYEPASCGGRPVAFRMVHVTTFEVQGAR